MSKNTLRAVAIAFAVVLPGSAVQAQDNTFKVGAIRYTTHSKTNGISGVGVPAGADAETGDATTLLLTYATYGEYRTRVASVPVTP